MDRSPSTSRALRLALAAVVLVTVTACGGGGTAAGGGGATGRSTTVAASLDAAPSSPSLETGSAEPSAIPSASPVGLPSTTQGVSTARAAALLAGVDQALAGVDGAVSDYDTTTTSTGE